MSIHLETSENQFSPSTSFSTEAKLDKELSLIPKAFSEITEERFASIAQAYLDNGNLDKALKTIRRVFFNHDTKIKCVVRIAESYFNAGDIDKALETNNIITHDDDAREKFFTKIAEYYYNAGDLDRAFKIIKEIFFDKKTLENFIAKIAEAYFQAGKLDKTFETINYPYGHSDTRRKFIPRIAEAYFQANKLEEALKTIQHFSVDVETRGSFTEKIINEYISKGKRAEAFCVLYEIRDILEITRIAQASFSDDETVLVKVVAKLLDIFFLQRMMRIRKEHMYYYISQNFPSKEFFYFLTKAWLKNPREYFAQHSVQEIWQEIERKADKDTTMKSFMNLEFQNKSLAELYATFGLEIYASQDEVRMAYKKLILQFHPDKQEPQSKDEKSEEFAARIKPFADKLISINNDYGEIKIFHGWE